MRQFPLKLVYRSDYRSQIGLSELELFLLAMLFCQRFPEISKSQALKEHQTRGESHLPGSLRRYKPSFTQLRFSFYPSADPPRHDLSVCYLTDLQQPQRKAPNFKSALWHHHHEGGAGDWTWARCTQASHLTHCTSSSAPRTLYIFISKLQIPQKIKVFNITQIQTASFY